MARSPRLFLKIVVLTASVHAMAACALLQPSPAEDEDKIVEWNGLRADARRWAPGIEQGKEVLRHLSSEGCLVEMIRGGSDVPPDWSVDKSWTSLGDVGYETFEVRSPDGIEYVNYFFQPSGEPVNIGGFQVRPGMEIVTCIEAAEALLSTLDPEGLRLRTPTPAG